MSGWVIAMQEVYKAGGTMPVCKMFSPLREIERAREKGMFKRRGRGGSVYAVTLTQRGIDYLEGRITLAVPAGQSSNKGRAPGSCMKPRATWLAALPRANEIRL